MWKRVLVDYLAAKHTTNNNEQKEGITSEARKFLC